MNLPHFYRVLGLTVCLALEACSSAPKGAGSSRPSQTSPQNAGSSSAGSPSPNRPATPLPNGGLAKRPGGYYQDDGPGLNPPDLEAIADAVPKLEPMATRANRPYSVFGIQYIPLTQLKPFRERGHASWYGKKFHGQSTSNGERYDMYAMTAAHPTLPLPSYAKVSNPRNGKTVIVRINDRGPFLNNRVIDLSYTAAAKLGYVGAGSAEVEVTLIDEPEKFAALAKSSQQPPLALSAPTAPTPSTNAMPSESAGKLEPDLVLTRETILTTAPPSESSPQGLYLQLGAFSAKEAAEASRQRLSQQFPWLAEPSSEALDYHTRTEAGLFKLHVGPFKTRAQAQTSIDRLRLESGLQAFVVAR
jgi:rare lipoprotein A